MEMYAGPVSRSGTIPITLLIANRGAPVSGTLDLVLDARRGQRIQSTAIDLPAKSQRRVQVFATTPYWLRGGSVKAELRSGDDLVVEATAPVTLVDSGLVVIDRRGVLAIPEGSRRGGPNPVYVPTWALPDSHLAYVGIQGILLADARFEDLTPAQTHAIVGYVHHGGTLIVSAGARGPDVLRTFVGELLPDATCDVVELSSLSDLGKRFRAPAKCESTFACAVLNARAARTMIAQGETPIAVEHPVLSGRVIWVGLDVWRPPFREWRGAGSFWQYCCTPPPAPFRDLRQSPLWRLHRSDPDPTPFTWVLTFFLVYALCFVALLFWLRRRRKPSLAIWLIAPLVAVLFAGLTPLVKFSFRNAASNLFTVSLVELFPHSRLARYQMAGVAFSRGGEKHEVRVPSVEGSAMLGMSRRRSMTSRQIVSSGPGRAGIEIAPFVLPMWGTKAIMLEGTLSGMPPIEGRVVRRGGTTCRLELRSREDAPIPAGSLLLPNRTGKSPRSAWRSIGTRPVNLCDGLTMEFDESKMKPWGRSTVGEFYYSRRGPPAARTPEWAALVVFTHHRVPGERELRRMFAAKEARSEVLRTPLALSPPWPSIKCDRLLEHKYDDRALVIWLPIVAEPSGQVTLPYGTLTGRTHQEHGDAKRRGPKLNVHEFELPRWPGKYEVEELRARVVYELLPEEYRLQIYDHEKQSWVVLHLPSTSKPLAKPQNRRQFATQALETVVPSPQRHLLPSVGVVVLRDNKGPSRRNRYVQGKYVRFGHRVEIQVKLRKKEAAK